MLQEGAKPVGENNSCSNGKLDKDQLPSLAKPENEDQNIKSATTTPLSPGTRSRSFSNFFTHEMPPLAPIPPITPSLFPRKSQQQRKESIKVKESVNKQQKSQSSQNSDNESNKSIELKITPPCPPPFNSDVMHPKVRRFRGVKNESSSSDGENKPLRKAETSDNTDNQEIPKPNLVQTQDNEKFLSINKENNNKNDIFESPKIQKDQEITKESDDSNQNLISNNISSNSSNSDSSASLHVTISKKESLPSLIIDSSSSYEIIKDFSPKPPPDGSSSSDSDSFIDGLTKSPPKRKNRTKVKKKNSNPEIENHEKKKLKLAASKSPIAEEEHKTEDLLARISILEAQLEKQKSSELITKLETFIEELKIENKNLQNENNGLRRSLMKSRRKVEDLVSNTPSLNVELRRRILCEEKLDEAFMTITELKKILDSKDKEISSLKTIISQNKESKIKPIQQKSNSKPKTQPEVQISKPAENSDEIINKKIDNSNEFNLLDIIDQNEINNDLKALISKNIDHYSSDYASDDSYSYSDSEDESVDSDTAALIEQFAQERENLTYLIESERKRRIFLRRNVDELTELLNSADNAESDRRSAERRLAQTHERLSNLEQQNKRLMKEIDCLRQYVASKSSLSVTSESIKLKNEVLKLKLENRKLKVKKPIYVTQVKFKPTERKEREETELKEKIIPSVE